VIGPFGSDLVQSDYQPSGVPVIFVRDIVSRKFVYKSHTFVSEDKAKSLSAHHAIPGDVLITKMGNPPGDAALLPADAPLGVITADVIRLRPNPQRMSPEFLSAALNAEYFRRQVAGITGGQTRPKLTLRDYRKLLLAVPPIDEQREIAKVLDAVVRREWAEDANRHTLTSLKATLSSALLTGELRVAAHEDVA
jgi:type I restriction enzyme S subunit